MADWLYKILLYGAFVPILIALIRHKYLDKALWFYFYGLLSALICGIISVKLGQKHINNHFMMYVNSGLTIILKTLFFYSFIQSKQLKNSLLLFLIIYLIGNGIDIYIHGIYMNQYLSIVSDVWITFFLLVCLNQILKDETIVSLRDLPMFWVIIGTLIFIIFDFFLAIANDWLYAVNRSFLFLLWDYITPLFMFILILFVSIGYWKTKKYAENLAKT